MQPATDATVLGRFDDARFVYYGSESRFFERNGEFFVTTDGPDGRPADFQVRYTFGVEPLQQYLIALPGGRLQALGIAWDSRPEAEGGGRWFHLYPDEHVTAANPLHWTRAYQTWNAMCADCHSTNLRKRYDPKTDSYATTWDEIDVGCEACHGPASAHVERAGQGAAADGAAARVRLPVDFEHHGASYQVELCARCHARRHRVSAEAQPARPLLDDFAPQTLTADLYHADGQVEDEVYVYGSFVQSKMYARGVRCSDCHDVHGLELRAAGNAVCTQCHGLQPLGRFPTLQPKSYDTPAHHFHPVAAANARGPACVDCHMPSKTFMGVDARRDHSIRVPRPDLSVKLGTPNACNMCHSEESAAWAAAVVAKWYGPARAREPHYGEVIAAARAGAAGAGPKLVALAGAGGEPAIVRASALQLLSLYGEAGRDVAVAGTRDADPLVRSASVYAFERLPPPARLPALAPLLTDPIRAVRLEAARALSAVPREHFDDAQRRAFDAALGEFVDVQTAEADLPGGRFNLALVHANQGRIDEAVDSYRAAIRLDPYFLPAQANLAVLYSEMGRNADAERVLRDAMARAPEEGELHYSLGLLLAEEQRLDEAAVVLERAAALLPARARVQYNYALALQHLGRRAEAERALLAAHALDQRDPAVTRALAIFYLQQRHWDEALVHATALAALAPDDPESQSLVRRIESARASSDPPP
jgi:tetratricopeptide (TPR) repeat protein